MRNVPLCHAPTADGAQPPVTTTGTGEDVWEGTETWPLPVAIPQALGEGIRGIFLLASGRIYLESCPWIFMISFWKWCMSLSLLWFHPELSNLWLWKLLFIHLSFCLSDFPKFSHTLPISLLSRNWEVSFSVACFPSFPILFACLCSLSHSTLSLLRCGDQSCTEHPEWKHFKALPSCWKNNALCPSFTAPFPGSWHPWNWGFKETAKASEITFLNWNCQSQIQHPFILVWLILS